MKRLRAIAFLISACGGATAFAYQAFAADRPSPALPGSQFQSPETRALQDDEARNPGMLWVENGGTLWTAAPDGGNGKSCASCHGDAAQSMKGVATKYPLVHASGTLLNIEARINLCRTGLQGAKSLAYESNELLGLAAFVTYQSRGMPKSVSIDGPARPYFEQGKAFFQTKQGQLDLACTQCHDGLTGRNLRGDKISQGQSSGWPAYRLEWQTLGSLHRRLRACSLGVRAEQLPAGSTEYTALELYLAWRGEGLPLESPGVRR